MIVNIVSVLVLFCSVVAGQHYYCAPVSVSVAGSVSTTNSGYFQMKIGNGYSKYAFNVDLSGADNCDFTLYPTVSYHIHTYTTNTSTTNTCTNTAGHYDPTLACSEKAQAHATECTTLSRTAATGYTYSCTAPSGGQYYYSNPTGFCEVGDLSGKFGKATVKGTTYNVATPAVLTDGEPPFAYNYNLATASGTTTLTTGWSSIVFHCGDAAGTRVACGNFYVSPVSGTSVCPGFEDNNQWDYNESCYNWDWDDDITETKVKKTVYGALIGLTVSGWVLAICFCIWGCSLHSRANQGSEGRALNSKV